MKKFKVAFWDGFVFVALVVLTWGGSPQTILLAVVAFLLYLLVRSSLSQSTKHSVTTPAVVEDENDFVVENEKDWSSEITLDTDIDHQPRKNHFRYDSQFDTVFRDAEFEYKIEGTNVFVRLLHESLEDIGLVKTWEVRDGVVLETDLRERWKNEKSVLPRHVEEEIADRKKAVEWHEILPSYWKGVKYFILLKNLSRDDARRFFRREVERLKMGSNRFIEEAAKLGFVHDEKADWRLRLPDGVDPPEAERQKLFDSITSFGITYDEFTMAPGLIAALEKYVA